MKKEEINPGDVLYDKEWDLLVKVARVDEDGVVKYSVYTDMQRIFKICPPPYHIGIHTAEAYVPATDVQRKYMEKYLTVGEYVNLPKNNRMETLAYIISDLKAENVVLEQRVHQLMDEYNRVAKQLREAETRKKEDSTSQTLGEMRQMRDHCDNLEVENSDLKRCLKAVGSFLKDHKLYMAFGVSCPFRSGHPAVCSQSCQECSSYLSMFFQDVGVVCKRRLSEAKVSFTRVEDS